MVVTPNLNTDSLPFGHVLSSQQREIFSSEEITRPHCLAREYKNYPHDDMQGRKVGKVIGTRVQTAPGQSLWELSHPGPVFFMGVCLQSVLFLLYTYYLGSAKFGGILLLYVYVTCVRVLGDQKKVLDPLELGL